MPYKPTDGAARAESCSHELCRVVTEVDHRSSVWPLATSNMSFKYYDLLSNLTVGIVAFFAIWKFLFPDLDISEWVIILAGYVVGYFLNAISSFT